MKNEITLHLWRAHVLLGNSYRSSPREGHGSTGLENDKSYSSLGLPVNSQVDSLSVNVRHKPVNFGVKKHPAQNNDESRSTGIEGGMAWRRAGVRVASRRCRENLGTEEERAALERGRIGRLCPGGNPGANGWFIESTPKEMLPQRGSICGRLTADWPSTRLQGGLAGRVEVRPILEPALWDRGQDLRVEEKGAALEDGGAPHHQPLGLR